jgi:V/A-type H+-transporting ATPase subunit D
MLKGELSFAKEGFELLDQKKTILLGELLSVIGKAKQAEKDIRELLREAYVALENAILREGVSRMEDIASMVNIETEITVHYKKVMGVSIPVVDSNIKEPKLHYSLLNTSPWIDQSVQQFRKVLDLVSQLAQLRISVLRLAKEIKSTIRKVNALEKISIPDYKETIAYIVERLEEAEREAFSTLKVLKKRR